ncbi:MAG: Vitamin B12 import ATP-binding protein BtuD [Anaerolineae bacterium]|nr:Vitamin B12 import ATP-binding protein BtuD [Anaerolineae bacterium]
MSNYAVRVENLSKKYKIGKLQHRNDTLRDAIMTGLNAPANWLRRNGHRQNAEAKDTLWALKDVSFDITHGEVVGIIGRNGAGKSTLLKILSQITEPTRGRAIIDGRVGSLLEVGTGFHDELTGRENIYLNGAILGMRKAEIERKFDEIVDFSGVEQFLDTPVKRYSSGMKVRLAFSVAAHLEPEILMVDEVLAVGDAEFQKKCLGKMGDITKAGRTVLFVSHNMGAITQLCQNVVVLQKGTIAAKGPSEETVAWYLANTIFASDDQNLLKHASERQGDGRIRYANVYLQDKAGEQVTTPISGSPIDIVQEFISSEDLSDVSFTLTIYNQQGVAVTNCHVQTQAKKFKIKKGQGKIICHIPKLPLPLGQYKIAVATSDNFGSMDWAPTACIFDVEASVFFETLYLPPMQHSTALVEHSWELG